MKRFLVIFLVSVISLSLSAQDSANTFVRSKSQSGVATSTDVIALGMPIATLAGVLITQDWKGLVQGAETGAVTAAATLILKYSIKSTRPDYSDTHSFPSAHSAVSFATAAFLQRRYGWKFGGPAYALATYVAWGRVYSKKHRVLDVVGGAAIGAASAYIFTKPFAQKHNLQVAPTSDGRNIGVYASFDF